MRWPQLHSTYRGQTTHTTGHSARTLTTFYITTNSTSTIYSRFIPQASSARVRRRHTATLDEPPYTRPVQSKDTSTERGRPWLGPHGVSWPLTTVLCTPSLPRCHGTRRRGFILGSHSIRRPCRQRLSSRPRCHSPRCWRSRVGSSSSGGRGASRQECQR
jgi:hypothetical protein